MHKLELTNGLRAILNQLIAIPGTFKTPAEMMQAAKVAGMLECPQPTEKQVTSLEWMDEKIPEITLSEKQREVLKTAATQHVANLPPNRFTISLLTQLGFE